ncbi:MAG: hypothetical protein Q8M25_00475 [Rhodoferax sp.]|nr:hypothetical protein [Rhodoferax sp.]
MFNAWTARVGLSAARRFAAGQAAGVRADGLVRPVLAGIGISRLGCLAARCGRPGRLLNSRRISGGTGAQRGSFDPDRDAVVLQPIQQRVHQRLVVEQAVPRRVVEI